MASKYPLQGNNDDVDQKKTHQWLRSSGLKAKTEGFILAPQDQSLLTRNYQAKVIKNRAGQRYIAVYALNMTKPLTF